MLTTIKGYYEEGHIFLNEEPPSGTRAEVIVTFLNDINKVKLSEQRTPGGLKGKVTIPDNFNDPLEDLKDYM